MINGGNNSRLWLQLNTKTNKCSSGKRIDPQRGRALIDVIVGDGRMLDESVGFRLHAT